MLKEYKATYTSETITKSGKVNSNGCSCISFENLGNDDALIDNAIPLTTEKIREFNEQPYVEIKHDFNIKITNNSPVLVIRTFYTEI